MIAATRIPVYLVTGWLGSGKTTLLAAWLRQPEFADAALVVNEIGEVGLDNRLLASAVESASLIANACVCCTGLPGLEEALADLFWARLQRRIARFPAVVIETTGLADPRPVIAAFDRVALLRERYRLAGVITTFAASAGWSLLDTHPVALAQVESANVLIVTKADLVASAVGEGLKSALHRLNGRAACFLSAHASVDARQVVDGLAGVSPALPLAHAVGHEHAYDAGAHGASATFMPLSRRLVRRGIESRLAQWAEARAPGLLRVKGIVSVDDGRLVTLQWAPGEGGSQVGDVAFPAGATAAVLGLTVIAGGRIEAPALVDLERRLSAGDDG